MTDALPQDLQDALARAKARERKETHEWKRVNITNADLAFVGSPIIDLTADASTLQALAIAQAAIIEAQAARIALFEKQLKIWQS